MTRDRLVSVFVVLVAATVAVVVVWLAFYRPLRRVVHDRPVVTTPIVSSPLTPLRDSGPKNNKAGRSVNLSPRALTPGGRLRRTSTGSQPPQSHSKRKKRQTPKTTPTPRPSQQSSPQPSQPSNPPPSPPPPVVGVTAPAPVTVCARPLATVNC